MKKLKMGLVFVLPVFYLFLLIYVTRFLVSLVTFSDEYTKDAIEALIMAVLIALPYWYLVLTKDQKLANWYVIAEYSLLFFINLVGRFLDDSMMFVVSVWTMSFILINIMDRYVRIRDSK